MKIDKEHLPTTLSKNIKTLPDLEDQRKNRKDQQIWHRALFYRTKNAGDQFTTKLKSSVPD